MSSGVPNVDTMLVSAARRRRAAGAAAPRSRPGRAARPAARAGRTGARSSFSSVVRVCVATTWRQAREQVCAPRLTIAAPRRPGAAPATTFGLGCDGSTPSSSSATPLASSISSGGRPRAPGTARARSAPGGRRRAPTARSSSRSSGYAGAKPTASSSSLRSRSVEVLGEPHDQLAARLRGRLHEAQVPRGDVGLQRQLHLTHPARVAPAAPADGGKGHRSFRRPA